MLSPFQCQVLHQVTLPLSVGKQAYLQLLYQQMLPLLISTQRCPFLILIWFCCLRSNIDSFVFGVVEY